MVSVQARLLMWLMLALRVRESLGARESRGGRSDPHGGGIRETARRGIPGATVTPVNAGGSPAGWVTPVGSNSGVVVYYLHGGAYVFGKMTTYRDLLHALVAKTRAQALWLDYRLAPECPFPAAVDDALNGYRWLLENGVKAERVIIAGDSAGGGLSLATMLAAREAGLPPPASAVLLSPWTDLAGKGESVISRREVDPMLNGHGAPKAAQRYLNGADPHTPLASPLYADLRGLPPLFIHVGDREILLDDSTRLAERATAAGVEVTLRVWPGLFHVFPIFPSILPEARTAVDEMASFILAHTSPASRVLQAE